MSNEYLVLRSNTDAHQEIKKSKFTAYLAKAASQDEAMAFLEEIRKLHPDAGHHCWAFIIGDPEGSNIIGMSDDGEPHGTAGKPILNVLIHKKIGDIIAVVVRYWGGTKLGTGGLVRAYGGTVQLAVEQAVLENKINTAELSFSVPFASEGATRRLFQNYGYPLADAQYSNRVNWNITLPEKIINELKQSLNDITRGAVIFD
jgi:uncharacterized YigZ family protein